MFSILMVCSVYASQPAVNLTAADNFTIIAQTLISDANPSVSSIKGNINMDPAAGSAITDVSCTKVNGNIYQNNAGYTGGYNSNTTCAIQDATTTLAVRSAMVTAYNEARGRTLPDTTEFNSGELGGQTLNPGLHKWSSDVTISNDVTLDCLGNASGVYIFQIAQTLDISNGKQVILSGNCQASNIFWQVDKSATLGTTSVFNGNILAGTAITIKSGATLNGKAFAQTAVTLDANTIQSGVSPVLTTITLTPVSKNLTVGSTQQLNATSFDQFGISISASITYASNNTSVAAVNLTSGLITAVASGNATITATSGTVSNTSTITVNGVPVLTTITLTPVSKNLTVGSTQQLNATSLDQFSNPIVATINYVSNDTAVATVNASGLVTAISAGDATIIASNGSINSSSAIKVIAPVLTTITLTPTSKNLTVGNTEQLNATSIDQFGTPIVVTINYVSNDTAVATVNASGLVTAITAGKATIIASNGSINSSSNITVNALPVLTTITLTPTSKNLTIGATQQLTATSIDQYGALITATITYTSNDTTVTTVSSSGLVTAVDSGSSLINASSGNVSAASTITVETAAPILTTIGSKSVTKDTWLNFTINATSPKGLNLTFAILGKPVTANFTDNNNGSAIFSWMPNSSNVGVSNVNFTVTDGIKSTSEIVAITVNAFQAPTTVPTSSTVDLGTAGDFVILAKSGVSTTGTTSIKGDVGVSPAAATYLTGFGLIMDVSNTFSTSSLVNGSLYAADYTPPTPAKMTTAVSDMETAYTDLAGRAPDVTELGAGNIGGLTLAPGVYKWSSGVTIPTDLTLSGSSNDMWIFQIAQTLDISNGKQVILSGGAQAKNIFWQVGGQTTLGTNSVFNGNILDQTAIVLNTGATLNGRALAQTAVTLDADSVNVVTVPAAWNSDWKNVNYNVTLNATGFNGTLIAYINYSLNNVSGQIIGSFGNVLINTSGNNTLTFYAVDTSGNVEASSTVYALLDKTAPIITSFTLSATSVLTGDTITGTCTATDNLDADPSTVITGISTSDAGEKTAVCTATDLAGNTNQNSLNYTVTQRASSSSGGGGGGSNEELITAVCKEDWICASWGTCVNGVQTRECYEASTCGTSGSEPSLTKTCSQQTVPQESQQNAQPQGQTTTQPNAPNSNNNVPAITGAIVGGGSGNNALPWIVGMVGGVALLGLLSLGVYLSKR